VLIGPRLVAPCRLAWAGSEETQPPSPRHSRSSRAQPRPAQPRQARNFESRVVYRVADTLTARRDGLRSLQCSPQRRASGWLVTELDVATGVARRGHQRCTTDRSCFQALQRFCGGVVVDHDVADGAPQALSATVKEVIRDPKPILREAEKAFARVRPSQPPDRARRADYRRREMLCRSVKPVRIPRFIWSMTAGPPFGGVCGQLQPRTLKTLGSALAGVDTPTAAATMMAAPATSLVITRNSPTLF
jgi:hypothetical protein